MDIATFVVDLMIGLWFLAVLVAIVRAWRARTPRLVPLTPEKRTQFVHAWHRIAAEFVDAPRETVEHADALVLALLHERGRREGSGRVPKPIQEGRRWLAREKTDGTEALRQAMLHYRSIFTGSIGNRPAEPEGQPLRRREMA